MKMWSSTIVAVLSLGVGFAVSPIWHAYHDLQPEGRALKCVARDSICLGMSAKQAIFHAEDNLGSLTAVYCGFDRPEVNVKEQMVLSDVIERGCPNPHYMAAFSDGKYLTGIWIENGKVVQLDRTRSHQVDF